MPLRPDEVEEVKELARKIVKQELELLKPAPIPKPASVAEIVEAPITSGAKKKEVKKNV